MTTRAELKEIMAERHIAVLAYLANQSGSLHKIAASLEAPPSTLYFLLCRMRDNDRLIHNTIKEGNGRGKIATWHLGPPATLQDDEADAVPIRRKTITTWPRDFPPPDPVLAHLYGRHV